jgi:hypothetical protein
MTDMFTHCIYTNSKLLAAPPWTWARMGGVSWSDITNYVVAGPSLQCC